MEPKQIRGLEKPCEDERVESPVRGSRYLVVVDTRVFECRYPTVFLFRPSLRSLCYQWTLMKGERGEGIEGRPSGPWEFILSDKILVTLVSFREHYRTTVRLVTRMELRKEGGKGNLSFLVRFHRCCWWKFRFTRVWIFFQVDGNNGVRELMLPIFLF